MNKVDIHECDSYGIILPNIFLLCIEASERNLIKHAALSKEKELMAIDDTETRNQFPFYQLSLLGLCLGLIGGLKWGFQADIQQDLAFFLHLPSFN